MPLCGAAAGHSGGLGGTQDHLWVIPGGGATPEQTGAQVQSLPWKLHGRSLLGLHQPCGKPETHAGKVEGQLSQV